MKKIVALTIVGTCLFFLSNIATARADSSPALMMELLTTSTNTPTDQRKTAYEKAKAHYLRKLEMIQTENTLMDLTTNPDKETT